MKHYKWVKDKINKFLTAKVIWGSQSNWSAPITVVPKGDGEKHLVINYHSLNKVTWKFIWSIPKVEDIFAHLNGAKYFLTLDLQAGYHHIPVDESSIPILLDNGTEFKNQLMDQILQQLGIDCIFSAPYQPQSNQKLEVFHKYLKPTLQKLCEKVQPIGTSI